MRRIRTVMDIWLPLPPGPIPDLKYLTRTPDTHLVSPIPTPLQAYTSLFLLVESRTGYKAGKEGASHTHLEAGTAFSSQIALFLAFLPILLCIPLTLPFSISGLGTR